MAAQQWYMAPARSPDRAGGGSRGDLQHPKPQRQRQYLRVRVGYVELDTPEGPPTVRRRAWRQNAFAGADAAGSDGARD